MVWRLIIFNNYTKLLSNNVYSTYVNFLSATTYIKTKVKAFTKLLNYYSDMFSFPNLAISSYENNSL